MFTNTHQSESYAVNSFSSSAGSQDLDIDAIMASSYLVETQGYSFDSSYLTDADVAGILASSRDCVFESF